MFVGIWNVTGEYFVCSNGFKLMPKASPKGPEGMSSADHSVNVEGCGTCLSVVLSDAERSEAETNEPSGVADQAATVI